MFILPGFGSWVHQNARWTTNCSRASRIYCGKFIIPVHLLFWSASDQFHCKLVFFPHYFNLFFSCMLNYVCLHNCMHSICIFMCMHVSVCSFFFFFWSTCVSVFVCVHHSPERAALVHLREKWPWCCLTDSMWWSAVTLRPEQEMCLTWWWLTQIWWNTSTLALPS